MRALPVLAFVALAAVSLAGRRSSASCAFTPAQQLSTTIASCTPVDTSKLDARVRASYAGVIVGWRDKDNRDQLGWIPASEKLDCKAAAPQRKLDATRGFACCDGDPNPPCLAGTSSILTGVRVH